jgi:hypothetical protein
MHAYIDAEQLGGLSLDEALRRLLSGFRCGAARLLCIVACLRTACVLPALLAFWPVCPLSHPIAQSLAYPTTSIASCNSVLTCGCRAFFLPRRAFFLPPQAAWRGPED